jgi:hypothetical protein
LYIKKLGKREREKKKESVPTIGRVLKKFLHHSSTEFISPLDR